jgi:hypothetical protein
MMDLLGVARLALRDRSRETLEYHQGTAWQWRAKAETSPSFSYANRGDPVGSPRHTSLCH